MNYAFLDFEFTPFTTRFSKDIYCAAMKVNHGPVIGYNLLQENTFLQDLRNIPRPRTLVAYGLDSELRCLNSLFRQDRVGPKLFDHFICLHREFKLICNRNRNMAYGDVISKKGKINRKYKASKSRENNEDKKYVHLLNALYKLCGEYNERHIRLKDVYTEMCAKREIREIVKNMKGLIHYCSLDTDLLPSLLYRIGEFYALNHPFPNTILEQMQKRGKYAELVTYKTQKGYFVSPQKIGNLCSNKDTIIKDIAEYILRTFPDHQTFSFSSTLNRYVFHADVVKNYIQTEAPPYIRSAFGHTKKGDLSLQTETLEKLYPNKHNLDPTDYLQQIYRYIYTGNALKGLTLYQEKDSSKSKKFGNFYDFQSGVVRPYFNDFGSQTSRNQPAANGYLLLKPAWLRNLLIPPPGHCIMHGDVTREEVLILGVLSQDRNLLADFAQGDIYVAYGTRVRAFDNLRPDMPEWKVTRAIYKTVVLAIMYGLGPKALAFKLSQETGRRYSQAQAYQLILSFWRAYPRAKQFVENYWREYRRNKLAWLPSGWVMWGNNYNERSVKNFPVQGHGAEVMREVEFELDRMDVWCPLTLHDGFLVYSPLVNGMPNLEDAAKLSHAISIGFQRALQGLPGAEIVQNDMKIFWPDYHPSMPLSPAIAVNGREIKIDYDTAYNDERAKEELKIFDKFFYMNTITH